MRRLQNYTPENFAKSASTGQKRKRAREHFSCKTCRSRKVACDRQQPCENCVKLKCPDECSYDRKTEKPSEDTPSNRSLTASRAELSSTNARVSRLENLVERLAEKAGVDVDEFSDDSPNAATDISNVSRVPAEHHPYVNATLGFSDTPHDTPFYIGLHHWAKPCGLEMKYFWINSRQGFLPQITRFTELANHFDHVRRKTLWNMAIFNDHTATPQLDLLAILPEREICDAMVTRFLLSLNMVFPVVVPRHLQSEVNKFWEQKRSADSCWLPLYIAIVSLGYQLPLSPAIDGNFEKDGRRTGKAMMESVIPHAIRLAQLSRRPSIPTFQTLLLIILHERLAQDWVDGNDLTNGYLGFLARMSATMGLHRDPKNFPGADEDEAETRRQIFWTFTFMDLEHVLQSGMPCQYRSDGHDVEAPHKNLGGWPPFMQYIIECIPICEKALRFSDGRNVDFSSRVMSGLADSLRHLASLGTYDSQGDDRTPIVVIQQAIYQCLNHRVHLLGQWPLLESKDENIKRTAEERIMESCKHMLESVEWIASEISKTPEYAREAWTHVAIALLRCPLSYAVSLAMLLSRRRTQTGRSGGEGRLKELTYKTLKFIDTGITISFDIAKAQVLHWTQYHTIKERVEAHAVDEPCTRNIDLEKGSGHVLFTVTQDVMDNQVDSMLAAIDKTRKTAINPPAKLLETPRVPYRTEETAAHNDGDTVDRNPFQNETEMLDWLFTFEDWTAGQEVLGDTTGIWQ